MHYVVLIFSFPYSVSHGLPLFFFLMIRHPPKSPLFPSPPPFRSHQHGHQASRFHHVGHHKNRHDDHFQDHHEDDDHAEVVQPEQDQLAADEQEYGQQRERDQIGRAHV